MSTNVTTEAVGFRSYVERPFEAFKASDGRDVPAGVTRRMTIDPGGDRLDTIAVPEDLVAKVQALKPGTQIKLLLELFPRRNGREAGMALRDIAAG